MSNETSIRITVDAAGLTVLARRLAWLDGRREHAIRLLHCIDGLMIAQIETILDGDAELIGVSPGPIELVHREDVEWKKVIAGQLALQQKREAPEHSPLVIVKRWALPRHMITEYQTVLRRILKGAFIGVSDDAVESLDRMFELDTKRAEIHNRMLAHLGLERGTEEEIEFSLELHSKYGLVATQTEGMTDDASDQE